MGKRLEVSTVFNIPFDEPTEAGQQAVFRITFPADTDRRRIKRELRKMIEALGFRDYNRVIKELGFQGYV